MARALPRRTAPAPAPWRFASKDAGAAYQRASRSRRQAVHQHGRADGAEHPGHRRHRRQRDLSGGPLSASTPSMTWISCPPIAATGFAHEGAGLSRIDHVTHNVFRGNMDQWAGFYERLFNFREVRYFDIEGKLTGLKSRAMTSPDGEIRIPDQRILRRQIADRGISARLSRRRHPAYRAGQRRHLCLGRSLARDRRRLPGHARHLLRAAGQSHQRPWRGCDRG